MTRIDRLAPAKINLTLAVGDPRPDGYHELRSIFLRVWVCDHLIVEPAGPGEEADRLTVVGADDLAIDGNLVLRAAHLIRGLVARPMPALRFTLTKAIPVAAGLGGGSSDAEAALWLACKAWDVDPRIDPSTMVDWLGSDVPYFRSHAPAALVQGVGEQVAPLPGLSDVVGVLLVTPRTRLSTAAVFAAFDDQHVTAGTADRRTEELAEEMASGMAGAALAAWTDRLADANDLWVAATAVEPGLVAARADLEKALGQRVLLSGSGPTLVALYPSASAADEAARSFAAAVPDSLIGSHIIATNDHGPEWRTYP
jgi:4-diphosphocytidyl-2-C-methyl-D-erythritol kinase